MVIKHISKTEEIVSYKSFKVLARRGLGIHKLLIMMGGTWEAIKLAK